MLRHTGWFDGRFFVFYEEIDLCVRARGAGWGVALLPEVCLWHAGGATTSTRLHVRAFYLARSRLLFLRKHRASFNGWALMFYEVALTAKIVSMHLWHQTWRAGAAYLHGVAVGLFCRGRAIREPYGTG
jgi:GT2 family glycosyltransferase